MNFQKNRENKHEPIPPQKKMFMLEKTRKILFGKKNGYHLKKISRVLQFVFHIFNTQDWAKAALASTFDTYSSALAIFFMSHCKDAFE